MLTAKQNSAISPTIVLRSEKVALETSRHSSSYRLPPIHFDSKMMKKRRKRLRTSIVLGQQPFLVMWDLRCVGLRYQREDFYYRRPPADHDQKYQSLQHCAMSNDYKRNYVPPFQCMSTEG